MTNAEISFLLENHISKNKEQDATYQPNAKLKKTLEYVNRFNVIKNASAVSQVRK
jgi:hypothetical protein